MTILRSFLFVLLLITGLSGTGYSQTDSAFVSVPLNNLEAFRDAGKNWVVAADAVADYTRANDIRPVKGSGAVVNTFEHSNQMHLITRNEFGDLELEADFLMAKNSNSGIYLQGRYEIQLFDSWTKLNPAYSDLGGVYERWTAQQQPFEGTPPLMNVARAPGLWQHIRIKFRAPVFNAKGEKVSNARFETVYVNGVLVQANVAVTGPTISALYPDDEKARGPLVFQGDHGPEAFRNIRYREITGPEKEVQPDPESWNTIDPIVVIPENKPTMIKTFLMYGDTKLTHVTSVGNPNEVNYSYDVKRGAVFQIWRGRFLDLTPAWRERGETQLAMPLGSVLQLSDAPSVAVLAGDSDPWPDSVAFDDLDNKGYTLDKQRSPTFKYFLKGMEVKDSLLAAGGGEGITRTITIPQPAANTYCRPAAGSKIEKLADGLYAINDKSYYIRIDKKFKTAIRTAGQGQELVVKYEAASPVTYSIIW